ncbi:hypothetical protein [Thermomonas sp.]|uniref:hypothetical protein n=1 Tax=Thermomonas sp. TaxID=1971895 RepID=UPI0039194CE1
MERMWRSVLVAAVVCMAMPAHAAGVRKSDKTQPGEIVLLRTVSARPAVRMHPPGMALLVDPSPRREIRAALGEMSDDEYGAVNSGRAQSVQSIAERIGSDRGEGALGAALGSLTHSSEPVPGGHLAGSVGGAVGAATRGIDEQVRGTLARFPLGGK